MRITVESLSENYKLVMMIGAIITTSIAVFTPIAGAFFVVFQTRKNTAAIKNLRDELDKLSKTVYSVNNKTYEKMDKKISTWLNKIEDKIDVLSNRVVLRTDCEQYRSLMKPKMEEK